MKNADRIMVMRTVEMENKSIDCEIEKGCSTTVGLRRRIANLFQVFGKRKLCEQLS